MRRTLLLAAVLAVLGAGSAQAQTVVVAPPGAQHPYQRWVDEALVPTPDVVMQLFEAPCPAHPAAGGCFEAPDFIWLTTGHRRDFWHELGHGFDTHSLTDAERAAYAVLTRHSAIPWSNYMEGEIEVAGLQEDFAEAYARCARSPTARRGHWLTYTWTRPALHRRICNFIWQVG